MQISQLAFNVPEDLEERLDALANEREEIASQQEKRYLFSAAQNELHEIASSYSQKISGAVNRRDYRQKRIAEIRQQEEFMKNSGCPDIENASCRFLSKAVEDVKSLPVELDNLKKCEEEIELLTSERDKKIADTQEEIERIGYDPKRLAILTASVTELSKYERIKKAVEQNKLEIARLEAEKESNDKNIGQCEENLLQVKLKTSEITETVNKLSESVDRQEQIKQQMAHLQTYVEQEKELPVYEERKQHVLERIESMEKEMEKLIDRKFILSSQLTGMDTMIEKMKETFSTDMVEETDRQIRSNKETLGELQIQKGVLLERLENIDTMRGEISTLNNGIAVAATGTVSVTAAYGTVLAAGTVFAVPATDQMEAVEFQTLRTVTFAENETMDLAVEAVIPGVSGNVPANTITIMASPINGVTAITNSEKTSGGAEEENDEDYYERIHAEFQDSQFYVANDADYIKWAKEVPGIGDCIVEPAVEGPGTVGLILVDSNGQPASSTLVTAVYNHIVSPNDRSKRLLPTGSSKLIVKSATVKTVDFACTGLVLDGVGLDDVISTFKTEMMAVYSAAKETNILRYNSARTVLSTITGVSDFIDFTMDGKRENIHLSSSEYADTGNVTFTLEGAET